MDLSLGAIDFLSRRSIHQEVRFATGKARNFDSLFGFDSLGLVKTDIDAYLNAQYNHFDNLVRYYHNSFDHDYRRHSSRLSFKLTRELAINAYATADEEGVIQITQGTILAIEDAAHTLMSDPKLHLGDGADHGVARRPEYTVFDMFRFVDYEMMIRFIVKAGIGEKHSEYGTTLIKLLSLSHDRQNLADFISTLSIFWLLGHEDAHIYLGHLKYFSDHLSVFPAEEQQNLFSELIAGLFEKEHPIHRKSAEIMADRNSTFQLVDFILSQKFFTFNSWLVLPHAIPELEHLPGAQIRCIQLIRLVVTSIMLVLTIFERNARKKNSNMDCYPNLGFRFIAALSHTIGRVFEIVTKFPEYELQAILELKSFMGLIYVVCQDVKDVLRNTILNGYTLHDLSSSIETEKEVLGFELSPSMITEISAFILTNYVEVKIDFNAMEHGELFKSFLNDFRTSLDIHSSVFFKHRLEVNPLIKDKIYESLDIDNKIIADLSRYLE
jgi:hypothetical protein